ncbi:MAG: glucosyl-dolichyl phosphate glucuronosyltransferase [Candidatus Binatota bacterium]|jgi:glycosyltransferase involved in cell wall biosynthesis|nr:glucosyl-dolichyl phosphate glucuronosyltransferase [Candidatus Binatota bacterium]
MTAPRVSVVVPTFDRRESLQRLLGALRLQTLGRASFEVIVVDNGSSDGSGAAVAEAARTSPYPLRCVVEPAPGSSNARNRGIREAAAPIVAFTDDDVEPEPRWLAEIVDGFEQHRAAAVGGRTVPVWHAPLPEWWLPEYEKPFARNWGETPTAVTTFPFFYSLNLAVTKEVLDCLSGFDPRLGPSRGRHLVGEDADLCRRIHESGGQLHYLPAAVVRHHVPPERLTRAFFRRRFYYGGATHAVARRIEGRPLHRSYHLRTIAADGLRWMAARDSSRRFRRQLDICYGLGFLSRALRPNE